MVTGIYQSIAILAIVCLFYAIDFALISRFENTRKKEEMKTGRSWDFTIMMFVVVAVLIAQPILLPQIGLKTSAAWGFLIQCIGVLFVLAAVALHVWARFHLQYFYAERVEVTDHHRVISTGPYALVRHPIIVSFFGFAIGIFLMVPALTTLLLAVYTFWDFSHAAIAEEALLSEHLPDYAEYMHRTPRFIPRLVKRD